MRPDHLALIMMLLLCGVTAIMGALVVNVIKVALRCSPYCMGG